MLACMNIQQVSTLLNIGSKLVNLLITNDYSGSGCFESEVGEKP